MRPNLFDYATSELSQDAMLCWLLRWADASYREVDPALHQVGRTLLRELLRAGGVEPPEVIGTVRPQRQFPASMMHANGDVTTKRLDILVHVDESIHLAIEDKVNAGDGNPFEIYDEALAARGRHVARVLLRTGDRGRRVAAGAWRPFHRADLLGVLRSVEVMPTDTTYLAFFEHLERWEAAAASFATTPVAEWGYIGQVERERNRERATDADRDLVWRRWAGFFEALQPHLDDCEWDYLPQMSGSIAAMWWGDTMVESGEVKLYLQVNDNDLVVKLKTAADHKTRHERWYANLTREAREVAIRKPERRAFKGHMTIAHLGPARLVASDGLMDFDATLARLLAATQMVRDVAAANP